MKYRIKQEGERFVPEYRSWFRWRKFIAYIKFYASFYQSFLSYTEAHKFLEDHIAEKKKKKNSIYYYT